MQSSASKSIRIVDQPTNILSKSQKQFNKLIKKIESQRQLLEKWQDTSERYQKKYHQKFVPELKTYNQHKEVLLDLFDKSYSNQLLPKTYKKKLESIICSIAMDLLAENETEHLKEIYNRYSDLDFDTEIEQESSALKAMMEQMLGMDIGEEFDFHNPEKMMAQLHEKLLQKEEQEEQLELENQAQTATRKKTAKSQAKELQKAQEEKKLSQSFKEIYRKLASALHPDREQDATERERKTVLMTRINTAYANKDLLELLELQLEAEQIDQKTISNLSDEKLKYYNTLLKEQCEELEYELSVIQGQFRVRYHIEPHFVAVPEVTLMKLDAQIMAIGQDIASIQEDIKQFKDIKKLKAYLKEYR